MVILILVLWVTGFFFLTIGLGPLSLLMWGGAIYMIMQDTSDRYLNQFGAYCFWLMVIGSVLVAFS